MNIDAILNKKLLKYKKAAKLLHENCEALKKICNLVSDLFKNEVNKLIGFELIISRPARLGGYMEIYGNE